MGSKPNEPSMKIPLEYTSSFLILGEILAKDTDCKFYELSAAEQVSQVIDAFLELSRDIAVSRRRGKQSLLDRMLGNKAARVYSRGKSDSALPKD